MASIGHPVVGDTLYGAAGQIVERTQAQSGKASGRRGVEGEKLKLGRNFLHAARLEFAHPLTGKPMEMEAPLPQELEAFLRRLESPAKHGAGS